MSILMTIVLRIVGSFVGGFLGYLIFGTDNADGFFQPSGIVGSIIGAIIVLWSTAPSADAGHHHASPLLTCRGATGARQ